MAFLQILGVCCLLAVLPAVIPDETCAWPEYFDVSVDYGNEIETPETNSWETKIRIKKNNQKINGKMKYNMWLTVLSNDTIEISYNTKKRDLEHKKPKLHYVCAKELEDSTFKVKEIRGQVDENGTFSETEPSKYRCIQFIQRSPLVLQWRHGSQIAESLDMLDCKSGFTPINPWPLVHLPVRKLPIWQNLHKEHNQSFPKLLKNYHSCPDLGGYQIRVFDKVGGDVSEQCKNDDPSPRLEFECVNGDGIRITQTHENCTAYSILGIGSKLHCLATWEEGRYQFSVVAPSYQSGINSFHCLRINKDDPTKEFAVLFLDTICGKGDVVKTKVNNFQIELRQASIDSLCGDTSDQCSVDTCDSMMRSCLATCNVCPTNDTLPIDKIIHGVWILQQEQGERRINVTEDTIELFDDGIFHAYSNGSAETDLCLQDSFMAKEDNTIVKYLLGGVPSNAGCGPRVTTLRAKKVSDSVLLAQIPAPAPLRANLDNVKLGRWCRNNYHDISTFGQLFRPVYPFQAVSGVFQNTSGYLTLISEENQEPAMCIADDAAKDVSVMVTFKSANSTEKHTCEGNFKTGNGDKRWELKFNCADGISVDLDFVCLGTYKIDADHSAFILKRGEKEVTEGLVSLEQNYYCIISPINTSVNSTVIFHNAGECDVVLKELVQLNVIEPMMTLTLGMPSSSNIYTSNFVTCVPVLCWLLYYILDM